MAITKLKLLRFMSAWPLVGNAISLSLAEGLLLKLSQVEKGFNSRTIRFSENLHRLYDSLEGFDTPLNEDFPYLSGVRTVMYTKTSLSASRLLERLNNVGGPAIEDFFKDTIKDTPLPFLDWYSNRDSFETFIGGVTILLGLYTKMYPRNEDGHVYTGEELQSNSVAQAFLASRHFKLLVLDFIEALRVVLHLEIDKIHERKG